jgi:hypothetical protein
MTLEAARDQASREFRKLPGVRSVGIGIGNVISVGVVDEAARATIPAEFAGWPVVVRVTAEIYAA